MATRRKQDNGESRSWTLLGQVGAVSAALGVVVGLGLGAVSHANAPEGNAVTTETAYAVTHFDHSKIASKQEPEEQPATF